MAPVGRCVCRGCTRFAHQSQHQILLFFFFFFIVVIVVVVVVIVVVVVVVVVVDGAPGITRRGGGRGGGARAERGAGGRRDRTYKSSTSRVAPQLRMHLSQSPRASRLAALPSCLCRNHCVYYASALSPRPVRPSCLFSFPFLLFLLSSPASALFTLPLPFLALARVSEGDRSTLARA